MYKDEQFISYLSLKILFRKKIMLLGTLPSSLMKPVSYSSAHITYVTAFILILILSGCSQMPFGLDEFNKPHTNVNGSLGKDDLTQSDTPKTDIVDQHTPFEAKPNGSLGLFGLNLNTYFNEVPKEDTLERLSRIEKAIALMNKDLKTLAEPVQRLSAVEKSMTDLVSKLDTLIVESKPVAVPQTNRPVPVTPQKTVNKNNPVRLNQNYSSIDQGQKGVLGIRTGEHTDKTRIVIDLNTSSTFSIDLDNNEKLLIIESNKKWLGNKMSGQFKSQILKSYNVQNIDTGSRLILQLNKSSEVLYQKLFTPNGNKYFRMVIDLKK
jgi:hypothetical protein